MLLKWVVAIIKGMPLGWYFVRPQGGDQQQSEDASKNEQLKLPI